MGAYLSGEKLDFGRKYSIKQDNILTKAVITSKIPTIYDSQVSPTPQNGAKLSRIGSSVEEYKYLESVQIKIKKDNIFLCDNLNFDNIVKGNITDASLFRFDSGARLGYVGDDSDMYWELISELAMNVDFSVDSEYVYITTSCDDFTKLPGCADQLPSSNLVFCGFLGLLKYNNKFIIYDIDSAVSWVVAEGAPESQIFSVTRKDNIFAIPFLDTEGFNTQEEFIQNVESFESITYVADTEVTIYYILHSYFSDTSSTGSDNIIIKGDGYIEEIHPIIKKTGNRRIENA